MENAASAKANQPFRQTSQTTDDVKQQVVVERGFTDLRLQSESVAQFDYQPTKCKRLYHMIVVRKRIEKTEWGVPLFEGLYDRYFFYITNIERSAEEVVFEANDRCDQENILAQLKGSVRALHAPVDNLVSNWAYMVMASLAWSLKAWFALWLPETGPPATKKKRKAEKRQVLRMEFKGFVNSFLRMPAQIVRTGRRLVVRLLHWNPGSRSSFASTRRYAVDGNFSEAGIRMSRSAANNQSDTRTQKRKRYEIFAQRSPPRQQRCPPSVRTAIVPIIENSIIKVRLIKD